MKKHNLAGEKFTRLVAIERLDLVKDKRRRTYWLCSCDCGNQKYVRQDSLLKGRIRSCGCYNQEMRVNTHRQHGQYKSRIYKCWIAIKERCYNSKSKIYKHYGGRGIEMCQRWQNSFENFYADMGDMPDRGTIERLNNDGNYEPSNCQWITQREQLNNTRRNVRITFLGKTQNVTQWAKEFGMRRNSIYRSLRRGKSLEQIYYEKQTRQLKSKL